MVETIRSKLESDTYTYKLNQMGLEKASLELVKLEEYKKTLDVAQALIQKVAMETQEQIKYSLEDIVNLMLDAMFPDMYTFQLIFEVKRNRTEARIAILDKGQEVDALESLGGGVCDCISISLRIALLLLTTKRRTLILDEPAKMISEDVKPVFYEILQKLSSDMGIQIIVVTHDPMCIEIADKTFKVIKDVEGVSQVVNKEVV